MSSIAGLEVIKAIGLYGFFKAGLASSANLAVEVGAKGIRVKRYCSV